MHYQPFQGAARRRSARHAQTVGFFTAASARRARSPAYRVDAEKGTLSPPRGFNIDPRGRFLLSVGLDWPIQAVSIGSAAEADRDLRFAVILVQRGSPGTKTAPEGAAIGSLAVEICYARWRRRRITPNPSRPVPRRARVAGSGTAFGVTVNECSRTSPPPLLESETKYKKFPVGIMFTLF
jgi:hypothetical protein